MSIPRGDIAVVGLAVMGQNLILNMNDHGFTVVAYNRTASKVDEFLAGAAKGTQVLGAHSVPEMLSLLKAPHRIMLMVKAGQAVDDFIEQLLPLLDKGDIIIDGGNTHWPDTIRREARCKEAGILFVGTGVSGGEEGARLGPSIMPGGNAAAWPHIQPIFEAIAAKTPAQESCCAWIGAQGAGHFVKMVHNGIEYGDMQIIAEGYQILRDGLGLSPDEIRGTFSMLGEGNLESFLIEITTEIAAFRDADGNVLLDKIKDAAGQKGTGKWTVDDALDAGIPLTLIAEAVFARSLSARSNERVHASTICPGPDRKIQVQDRDAFLRATGSAMLAAKIISYAQGFMLMQSVSNEKKWDIDLGKVAQIWRAGCIIRSVFLDRIKDAFVKNPQLPSLLIDPWFVDVMEKNQQAWRFVVSQAALAGIPTPAISSALAFYDGYRCARSGANMIQAQRDYFGAHTYERIDRPAGEFFHTNWTGTGGDVASSTYNA